MSHIFLPLFKKNDFLLFSQWNMFSFMPMDHVYDITWDGGKTFLFRDYRKNAKDAGIDIRTLFYLINKQKTFQIKKYFYPELMRFCKCKNLKLVQLKGSLSDHIIHNKKLKIQKKQNL